MSQVQEDGLPGIQEQITPFPIHLHVILDVSPSMISRWGQTISGLNEYIDSLRKDQSENDQPYKVTMTVFSAVAETLYKEVELDSIPKFTNNNLQPHGYGTALYDAVYPTVQKINTTDPVLVVILTDGEENSSRQWDEEQVDKLLEERQKLGNYTYAYLGVAKEAWGQAARIKSFATSNMNLSASQYTGQTFTDAEKGLAGLTRRYSATMRSNARNPMRKMSVTNFYDQPQPEATTNSNFNQPDPVIDAPEK